MFHPVAFIYLLFFVNNPSLLGEQRLWTDHSDWMKIPPHGEKWFKGMPLDISCYMDFIKTEFQNQKI
jgi:hypothetical protein